MNVSAPADHDTFRDELASIAQDGRRRWIYARQPAGPLYRARTLVSVFLLAFLLLAPFVRIHGQPLMLLNVLERRFVLLGMVFRPQDFYLVVLIALTALVTLVLSTVVVGRVWCGWLCPQTIFMEMLFRKLEYLIEGSAEQQVRRDRGAMDKGEGDPQRNQARRLLRTVVRDRERVPGVDHWQPRAHRDCHRSTRPPSCRADGDPDFQCRVLPGLRALS